MVFDWHGGLITPETPVCKDYRNTQNVRRFMREQCGEGFKFDRALMAWIIEGTGRTMGDVVDEWRRRHG